MAKMLKQGKQLGGVPFSATFGMRVTVGTVVGLLATGHDRLEILKLYPYLEEQDIVQSLQYAAGGEFDWRCS